MKKIKCLLLFVMLITAVHITNAQEAISRINMQPMKVVYMVDTAVTADSISPRMGKAFDVLFTLIRQQ